MRRFSQRNQLVTLSEINITPLLDLAFVLLIIFIITTPLLEQGLNIRLPQGGQTDMRKIEKSDIRTVEVSVSGQYMLNGKWMTLDQITAALANDFKRNPNLIVDVRGDENGAYKYIIAVVDRIKNAGIDQVSLRTHPPR
jgi:biopolymer transport protein ExbD